MWSQWNLDRGFSARFNPKARQRELSGLAYGIRSIGKANSGRIGSSGKMQVSITLRALWWAIKAHRGQQWPEGHFTRSQVEQGKVPYGTIIVFG